MARREDFNYQFIVLIKNITLIIVSFIIKYLAAVFAQNKRVYVEITVPVDSLLCNSLEDYNRR